MIISDLNYLEVVQQETSVVRGGEIDVEIYKDVDVDVYEDVDIYKDFDVDSEVYGISAFAEAEALAYGYNAHAEGLTFTYTDNYYATASAQSLSQTNGSY